MKLKIVGSLLLSVLCAGTLLAQDVVQPMSLPPAPPEGLNAAATSAPAEPAPAAVPEAAAAAAPQSRPRIACDQATYNFGTVDESRDITHDFVIKNTGDLTLEIASARPACGCTVANISRNSVPPGETATIQSRLSLRGRLGPTRKNITVASNDPDQPQFILWLEGTVEKPIVVEPDRLYLGRLEANQAETRTVTVSSPNQPLFLTGLTSTAPFVEAQMKTLEDGKRYEITITTKPPLPFGVSQANVQAFDTNTAKTVDIPVTFAIEGPLVVAPQELILPAESAAPIIRYVIIRPGTVSQFKITKLIAPRPDIQTQVTPLGDNGYRIEISNITALAELNGQEMVIETDAPGMEPIKIPFKLMP